MRTYFDRTAGTYIGSWNWPATPEQLNHPSLAGHPWKEGQVGSGLHRLNLTTDTVDLMPVAPEPLAPTLVEQILASPKDLVALKAALGL
jgi:hypothetical protein